MGDEGHGVTVTVRVIRSFEHRNVRPFVLHDVNLETTAKDFIQFALSALKNQRGFPPPVKNYDYDTLKIEHTAHGFKTNDPVINTENDEALVLKPHKTLKACGVEDESDLSLFKWTDYVAYVQSKERS